MQTYMQSENGLLGLLLICCYCDKQKNAAGIGEKGRRFYQTPPDFLISHSICPECLREHFPEVYISLCAEGKMILIGAGIVN